MVRDCHAKLARADAFVYDGHLQRGALIARINSIIAAIEHLFQF